MGLNEGADDTANKSPLLTSIITAEALKPDNLSCTKFCNLVSKHINYFHIVDAKGADGEGVEIGKGDVNFVLLSKIINKNNANVPFIPEVWQGHKDSGAGFFNALNFLEKYL